MKLLLAALVFAILPLPALAQTTTFVQNTDCNSGITVSGGGLILTAINNLTNQMNCRADVGKYQGKWMFEVTPSNTSGTGLGWTQAVGVANSSLNTSASENIGSTANSVGYLLTSTGGNVDQVSFGGNWRQTSGGTMPFTLGKTIGVAINMDTNPRQIWVTPDISGTSGYAGGPLWNGDATSSPEVPGTGQGTFGPGDTGGTGLQFFLTAAYPAWTGQDFSQPGSTVTFDFASSLASIPDYLPWNTNGGAASNPGPGNPMTRNIANAPAWQQSTVYNDFTSGGDNRVLAGPGYNPATTTYTNGQPLYLWAVASGGHGTSGLNASYSATFASCPSPANTGGTVAPGGYTGSGSSAWAAATHVTDGGVTWVCLTPVDYNTFTGANVDDVVNWAPGTDYYDLQFAINPATNNVYYLAEGQAGYPPSPLTCHSGLTAPTGTTFGVGSSDGNCSWIFEGHLGYSSKANVLPHELYSFVTLGTTLAAVPQYNWDVTTRVWWGGAARQVYENDQGGEATQIFPTQYFNQANDNNYVMSCPGAASFGGISIGYPTPVSCWNFTQEFTVAPGDSFTDNMNPASDPLRYDPSKGVALHSGVTLVPLGNAGGHPNQVGAALAFDDGNLTIDRFMLQASSGAALAMAGWGPGHYNDWGPHIYNNYLDSGGGVVGWMQDGWFNNNVSICRGTGVYWGSTPMCYGMKAHYAAAINNNTFIGPDIATAPTSYTCPDCIAIQRDKQTQYGPILSGVNPEQNNLAFGWGQALSIWQGFDGDYTNPPNTPPYNAGYAATDLPSSYAGGTVTPPAGIDWQGPYTVIPFPGVSNISNLHATDIFVHPAFDASLDLRLKPGTPVISGGNNFAFASSFGTLTPGPDMFGQTCPTRIGPVCGAGGPAPAGLGGRGINGLLHR